MTLLVSFLCRFGWGMAVGLLLTPSSDVPAGFFRVNLLVVMGLATLAALAAATAWPLGIVCGVCAVAAVAAWLGGIGWLAARRGFAIGCTVVVMLALAAATVASGAAAETAAKGLVGAVASLSAGLVIGLSVHAMLLGHWYLNAPGMRVDILQTMVLWTLAAWGLEMVIAVAGLPTLLGLLADPATAALGGLRWIAGLLGLPVLLVMSRRTLEIPNTQSATGILYVACLAAIVGELTAQLLSERARWAV
ncbi:MAG: hypothetical protein ISQ70_08790 [Pirellulales bacterium]|nr:hypothetical protein [Pirellulales bacterium]MBL7193170.1 hypothetical protein [Pirellulales bacterium]